VPASQRERTLALLRGETRGFVPGLQRAALWCAQWPYRAAVSIRNRRYDRGVGVVRLPVPIVGVGNLSTGGTGKTVAVEAIARFYRDEGRIVAILSRGYGSADGGPNDEAMLLEENLPDVPHLQGADRSVLAQTALDELDPDVLLLDDGFQHRRLGRTLDIAMIDAAHSPYRDHLLPRGFLREPVTGLARAHAVLLSKCDQVAPGEVEELEAKLKADFPHVLVARTSHTPIEWIGGADGPEPADWIAGREVAAFCGLGQPKAFERSLMGLGANVVAFRTFPDHYNYGRADVDELSHWAGKFSPGTVIATTQKDWVKLRLGELGGRPLRALRIGLNFQSGEAEFHDLLRSAVPDGLEDGEAGGDE